VILRNVLNMASEAAGDHADVSMISAVPNFISNPIGI